MTHSRSFTAAEPCELRLPEPLREMAKSNISPAGYVRSCWERARALEPDLRAFAYLPPEPPAAVGAGPLAGIPVGLKDIIDTVDMPTENGSAIFAGRIPDADAF